MEMVVERNDVFFRYRNKYAIIDEDDNYFYLDRKGKKWPVVLAIPKLLSVFADGRFADVLMPFVDSTFLLHRFFKDDIEENEYLYWYGYFDESSRKRPNINRPCLRLMHYPGTNYTLGSQPWPDMFIVRNWNRRSCWDSRPLDSSKYSCKLIEQQTNEFDGIEYIVISTHTDCSLRSHFQDKVKEWRRIVKHSEVVLAQFEKEKDVYESYMRKMLELEGMRNFQQFKFERNELVYEWLDPLGELENTDEFRFNNVGLFKLRSFLIGLNQGKDELIGKLEKLVHECAAQTIEAKEAEG